MNPNIETVKINDNTFRIEDGMVRFFLLVGSERALLIDSGVDTPDAKDIAKALTDKPVCLLNTHGDGDHTSGNGAFGEYYIGEEDYSGQGLSERFPNSKPVFVKDGDEINLGGRLLRVISIPGHTYGSIAVLDVAGRMLFAGDTVSTSTIFMFGANRDTGLYAKSLEKLDGMKSEFDAVYPSHGTACLEPDAIGRVRADFAKAMAGELPVTEESLFGSKVATHKGEYCGFYLPLK